MNILSLIYPPVCASCSKPVFWEADLAGWQQVFETQVAAYPDRAYEVLWVGGPPPRRGVSNLFCAACLSRLSFPRWKACPRCGGHADETNPYRDACSWCHSSEFAFTRTVSLGPYWGPLRDAITAMKSPTGERLAQAMAALLWCQRGAQIKALNPECVIPVPMHSRRKRERGMNSPEVIAEVLASLLHVPVRKHLLWRVRATALQVRLKPAERWKNVRGAFATRRTPWDTVRTWWIQKRLSEFSCAEPEAPRKSGEASRNSRGTQRRLSPSRVHPCLVGRRVLLVDDVLTTGATCHEAAQALLQAGAREVVVAVIARAQTLSTVEPELEIPA